MDIEKKFDKLSALLIRKDNTLAALKQIFVDLQKQYPSVWMKK